MFSFFLTILFIIIGQSRIVFIDSSFEGIIQTGNTTNPYSKLEDALETILIDDDFENDFLILTNSKIYFLNSTILSKGAIKIKYPDNEKSEKAVVLLDINAQILIQSGGQSFSLFF